MQSIKSEVHGKMKKIAVLFLAVTFLAVPFFAVAADYSEDMDRDLKERKLAIEERKQSLEERKWEYEVTEKEEKKLKDKLSRSCNIEREIPVITIDTISGSTPDYIRSDLALLWELGHKTVKIDIFSGGGSAFGGLGIADTILYWDRKGMEIVGHAYGLIASAAVPVFASCTKRYAGPSTLWMVHEAAIGKFMTYESTSDIKAQKEMLDTLQHRYCLVLESRSNKSADEWAGMIKETTWFDSNKAVEWGLVDEIE